MMGGSPLFRSCVTGILALVVIGSSYKRTVIFFRYQKSQQEVMPTSFAPITQRLYIQFLQSLCDTISYFEFASKSNDAVLHHVQFVLQLFRRWISYGRCVYHMWSAESGICQQLSFLRCIISNTFYHAQLLSGSSSLGLNVLVKF